MRSRITTRSGSVYLLDTEAKTLTRTPGVGAAPVMHDGKPFRYEYLAHPPQEGHQLMAYWDLNGRPKLRSTTPVVSIEEIQ